jgi:hypothetical protein
VSSLALDFLTHIESREARLLGWGFVDGSFTLEELIGLGDLYAIAHDESGAATGVDLVAELRARALLLEVPQADGTFVYRSRAAEAIRLLARLRQLFPRNRGAGWANAPTLVADYRLLTRPRAYPKRDLDADELRAALANRGLLSESGATAIERLTIGRGGEPFKLSRFQLEATVEILAGIDSRRSGGTIIGAGTGSGKTLAFYLPALTHLIGADHSRGTRVLAIYPRIELLRDQFAETYREARRLDGSGSMGRPVRIAALYGSTPFSAAGARRYWEPADDGRACPYMSCPVCGEGRLVWPDAQIQAGEQGLTCSLCHSTVPGEHLVLTRDRMLASPPDVLFTSTEMLNRLLTDARMRRLVGVGPSPMPIDLVLLDEVHTYEGSTGAQVAGVLRRWRHLRRGPVHFVGLSATLRRAGDFFAQLTGLSPHQVTSIEPRVSDLEYEGQEYLLAVRADPASGASVLSTTIQLAMLMQRALDPLDQQTSKGAIGQRLFAFTDDLDVTNRLYFDLLDAEGIGPFGQPEKPPLAALRSGDGADLPGRRMGGQSWEALERIGHRLDDRSHLRIGRTTSQDADVDRTATAIVATASLEVGFNDPRVGAVIQHKSPHDAAAFLQRKGRAGRLRPMRPWTIVVLSDFGRDRLTYQAYERLFDPDLPARSLPVANPAVVRMQAVFATLDWLADRVRNAQVWRLLSRPPDPMYAEQDRPRQRELAEQLLAVLDNLTVRSDLERHLQRALGCDETALREILWEPPRPLLTAVIPTAIRRLQTGWNHLELGPERDFTADGPLPDFVVSRLFGDLALPEITVITPPQARNEDERREPMRAFQALTVYAPGRISHRLTITHRAARHWVPPPPLPDETPGELDIRAFAEEFEEIGVFGNGAAAMRVIRPLTLRVEVPPKDVLSSSNGRLRWQCEIQPSAPSPQVLHPPHGSPLAELVAAVRFHTHGSIAHVEVRRWAGEVDVETLTHRGAQRGLIRLLDGNASNAPVAVGLALDVDAVLIESPIAPNLLTGRQLSEAHVRRLRVDYFMDTLRGSTLLQRRLGGFAVERIGRALIHALIQRATSANLDLASGWARLGEIDELLGALADALARERSGEEDASLAPRIAEALERLRAPELLDELSAAVGALWATPDGDWDRWASRRLSASLGAAFHAALQDVCPEFDASDLVVDIEDSSDHGTRLVWLSEQTIGGGGIVQEALQRIAEHPRRFFDLVAAAIEPSTEETVDLELAKFVEHAHADPRVKDALAELRGAESNEQQRLGFDELIGALDAVGIFTCHPVVSALSVRFLRPGADERIDHAARDLLGRWSDLEERLGIEIDLLAFAELDAHQDAFDRASGLIAPPEAAAAWRSGQIAGLLWPRGGAAQANALTAMNPFNPPPRPDVALLRELLPTRITRLDIERLGDALGPDGPLAKDGDVELTARPVQAQALRRSLLTAAATAVESGPLLHFPRVDAVRRAPDEIRARLVLELVGE